MKKWLQNHGIELLVFALFIFAWSLRADVDGLPLTHPGNIKAADPMYHALAAQTIVDDEAYGRLAPYFAQGYTNMIDQSPPLNYLATAGVTKLTGLPVWVVMYLLVTFFEAAGVLILYLLCVKAFDSKMVGLLAAGLYVLPFGLSTWWYGMYIGLWNNIGGFFFFYASLYLALSYWKEPKLWRIIALSVTISGAWLIHVAELFFAAFAIGFVVLAILWKVKPLKQKMVHALALGIIPLISVILFYPRYHELSAFLTAGSSSGAFLGWYYPLLSGLPFYSSLAAFPWWLLVLAAVGVVQLALNWRKYLPVITGYTYLVAHLFVLPWFLSAYYFFVRQRMALPFLIAPLVAYGLYYWVVRPVSNMTKLQEIVLSFVIIAAVIGLAWPEYAAVHEIKGQEHLSPASYAPLVWIQENTPVDAEFVFVTGYYQMSGSFAKRVGFVFDIPDLPPALEEFVRNNGKVNLTLPFLGSNGDTEMGNNALDEGSFFTYAYGEKRRGQMSVLDFEYAVFKDFQLSDQPIVQAYNHNMIATLVQMGWSVVYNEQGIYILKKGESNGA